jgi:hypothetical protein
MALRWRRTGELLCAAKSEPLSDDTYIDDRVHYQLSVILGVIAPQADEEVSGYWDWVGYGEWVGPVLPGYADYIHRHSNVGCTECEAIHRPG